MKLERTTMNDEQNKFYTSIAKHYSEIFPFQAMQLKFVENRVGDLSAKNILDIGCATGELAFRLAERGASVTGIDLNEDLLERALARNFSPNLQFQQGDMLELENDFTKAQFDTVLCFGNTLVHLPSIELMQKMVNGVFAILKNGGKFLLQILNYDYILEDSVSELPLIESENIRFARYYYFDNLPLVRFRTQLENKADGTVLLNETSLLGLKSGELIDILKVAGFSEIELSSNFGGIPFGGKHLPLVVSAVKT